MYKSSYPGGLRLPKLGKRDRAIYETLLVVCAICPFAAGAVLLLLYEKIPFASPEVIGFANRAFILGFGVVGITMILMIDGLYRGCTRKYPIFGDPGEIYGWPRWTPIYPLLMPKADVPEEIRPGLRRARKNVCLMLAGVVLAGVIFSVSLLSGNRLHADGSIHIHWGFGWEVMEYRAENVEEVTVSLEAMGSRPRKYEVVLNYKMDDDRHYKFCVREFRDDGETSPIALLVDVLRCYPDADIDCLNGGRIPDLVYDQQYNDKEERLLIELFNRY